MMLKQMLLIGAAAVSFPALAQTSAPADPTAPPTAGEPAPDTATPPVDPPPIPDASPPPTSPPPASTPPASTQPAPSGAAATPTQIAQIVEQEFPTHNTDHNH